MKKKKIFKSSISGLIVSRAYAEANPDTTFQQSVDLPATIPEVEKEIAPVRDLPGGEEKQ